MRIHYMSDLHLEFGAFNHPMPSGEVLILAGDITVARVLDKSKTDSQSCKTRERTLELFDTALKNFGRVFYLFGNHEPYGFDVTKVRKAVERANPNIEILDNTTVELSDDTLLAGGTLWTDMDGDCDLAKITVGSGMNDFHLVTTTEKKAQRRFTPNDAVRLHRMTRTHIAKTAKKHRDKRIIVATHHAPSFQGINPVHGGNRLDAGYASDLELYIESHPNITHWVHGHTHIQKSYRVANCQVMANCRGYVGYEQCAKTFNPDTYFEV